MSAMVVRVLQRYVVGVVAFAITATVTGVGLVAGLECLLVFTLVYGAGAAYQQRTLAQQRRARPRRRRPTARVRDDDTVADWPQAVDWPSAL